MPRAKKPTPDLPPEPWRVEVETFRHPDYTLGNLRGSGPDAFNGMVNVRKYRVVAELIDEPVEVIRARIVELWEAGERNTHHVDPLQREAARYGLTLDMKTRCIRSKRSV